MQQNRKNSTKQKQKQQKNREAIAAEKARKRYEKMHAAGQTDEAKAGGCCGVYMCMPSLNLNFCLRLVGW